MANWTVYRHTCLFNNKVYIGITSRKPEARWGREGNGYQQQHHPHFYNAIQKYGWNNFSHDILFTNLTQEEAEAKEIELITLYKANDREYGYNELAGGNCTTNPSLETRKKQSESRRGRIVSKETRQKLREANLGQKRSDEARQHMSQSAKKRKRFPVSQETKDKIGDSNRGKIRNKELVEKMRENAPNKMPVKQYDLQGNFIGEFVSVSEASRNTGVNKSHILECCYQKTNSKSCGGYQWKFSNDERIISPFISEKAPKPVAQYTLERKFLKKYNSASEAMRETGIDASSIGKCCKGKLNSVKGFLWEYV